MNTIKLVEVWFEKWSLGDFENLPVTEDFTHTSPYGEVKGKSTYLDLVRSNKDQFLGNQFEIRDVIFQGHKACVRYIMYSKDQSMEISEWFVFEGDLIKEIYSYYNLP